MIRRLLTIFLVPALALGAAQALAQGSTGSAPPPVKKLRVLLSFRMGITFFPISVANDLGYMKEEGIDLDLQVANGSSAVIQQLAGGNAEVGVILAPNTLLGFAEGERWYQENRQ